MPRHELRGCAWGGGGKGGCEWGCFEGKTHLVGNRLPHAIQRAHAPKQTPRTHIYLAVAWGGAHGSIRGTGGNSSGIGADAACGGGEVGEITCKLSICKKSVEHST